MSEYPTPPGDSLEPLVRQLRDLQRQLNDLQRPSGTNIGSLVAQVQATLANINATVAAAISANSYTQSQINALVASPGAIAPTSVTASGPVYSGGILRSPGSRAYNVTAGGSFVGTWQDGAGNFGFNPSGVEFKQDFEPADLTPMVDAILRLGLIRYRYIGDVEARGDDAPYYLGSIAQYMATGPLSQWVVETDSGAVINWEQIAIPLVAAVQRVWAEHQKVRADTDMILAHLGLAPTA